MCSLTAEQDSRTLPAWVSSLLFVLQWSVLCFSWEAGSMRLSQDMKLSQGMVKLEPNQYVGAQVPQSELGQSTAHDSEQSKPWVGRT